MTHVTCRLTTKIRDQLRNPMLGNRVWATFTFLLLDWRGFTVWQGWRWTTWLVARAVSRHSPTTGMSPLSLRSAFWRKTTPRLCRPRRAWPSSSLLSGEICQCYHHNTVMSTYLLHHSHAWWKVLKFSRPGLSWKMSLVVESPEIVLVNFFRPGKSWRMNEFRLGKSWNCVCKIFKTWKVLENEFGCGKFWKSKCKVL